MNWLRWIRPALAVSFLLAIVALFYSGGDVTEDIGARTEAALEAQGFGWASIDSSFREVVVKGIAPSEAAQRRATEIAQAVRGVRGVMDATRLLPLISPYTMNATLEGGAVTITGAAPSEGAAAALLAEARRIFPTAEITTDLLLGRGAPDSYGTAASFALERLANLEFGTVGLSDTTLVLSGTALDAVALGDIRASFSTVLPAGLRLGPIEVLPPRAARFVWSASVADGQVSLAGFVPNDAIRDMVATSVSDAFPDSGVVDQTVVASGEPDGFLDAVSFAVEALTKLDTGGVTLDQLTLDLAGTAKSVDAYEALLANIDAGVPTGLTVVAADVIPATVSDYTWRGEVDGGRVAIAGFVPTLQDQRDLADLIRGAFADAEIENNIRVALGGPGIDWTGAVKFALGELTRLKSGAVSIDGAANYAISGTAASSDEYAALALVSSGVLPASLSLASVDVQPPRAENYRLLAELRGRSVVLTGYVANHERRRELRETVALYLPAHAAVDETEFASGAPDGLFASANAALPVLARMSGGRAFVTEGKLDLSGSTFHQAAQVAIENMLAETLPDGVKVSGEIRTRQPPQPVNAESCGADLSSILKRGRIEFVGTQGAVSAESIAVLDRMAAKLTQCPETLVEIGVHSDSDGSRETNLRITERRAEMVQDFLIDAGIKRERLTAVGYGEGDPIADNATDAGKAANRRIELALGVREPVEPFKMPPEPTEPEPVLAPSEEAQADGGVEEQPEVSSGSDAPSAAAEPDPEVTGSQEVEATQVSPDTEASDD